MTLSELNTLLVNNLTRIGSNRITGPEILQAAQAIVSYFATQISDIIPDWTAALQFETDGSNAGKYCKYPDTTGKKRLFETKVAANINHAPPTNPSITEDAFWIEVSASSSSAIQEWSAGVYGPGLVIVAHNHSVDGRGLYWLIEPVRPYNSTDIEAEITAGDWELISGGGGGASDLATVLGVGNDAGGNQITNLSDPSNPQDADTKGARDAAINSALEGIKWKQAVDFATTGNIVLSGPQSVDGAIRGTGNSGLVKDQTNPIENGIYDANSSGAWTRRADADAGYKLVGAAVSVLEGTANEDSTWKQITDFINIGVDNIVWSDFGTSVPDASPSVKGKAKLYTDVAASNTDGSISQAAAVTALALKVAGPSTSVDFNIALYNGTTGKIIKDSGARLILNGTNGVKGHYLGYGAGNSNVFTVSDGYNVSYGPLTLSSIVDGVTQFRSSNITAIGYGVAKDLTTAARFTGVGAFAGYRITTGDANVLIGDYAGWFITTQSDNTIVGSQAASGASYAASSNTMIGRLTGSVNTTGNYNLFAGLYAGLSNTTGNFNVYAGAEAAETNNTGSYNVSIGHWALLYATASSTNTVVGGDSFGGTLTNPFTVNAMVGLGYRSGVTETPANATVSGTGDTFIGTESGAGSATQISYATGVGFRAQPLLSYEFALGSYTTTYKPNWGFGGSGFGSGRGIIFVKDYDVAPTGDPASGFWMYSNAGNATIKSVQQTFIGDYTGASDATPLHAFTINKNVTQTGSATNKIASIVRITGTITASGGGGTQELNTLLLEPTFNGSLGSRNFYIHAKSSTGGSAFHVREVSEDSRDTKLTVFGGTSSATEMAMQTATNATYWTSTGPTNLFINNSSSTAAIHNFSINNVTVGGFTNQTTVVGGRGFNVAPITAASATSTASQVGSSGLFVNGNFWTGSTSFGPAGFYQYLVASTSVNRLAWWRLRENISAVDPGDILSVQGGADFGLGLGVSLPTARLHLMAGAATANQGPLKLTSSGSGITGLLTTPEKGVVEFTDRGLWFSPAASVRDKVLHGLIGAAAPATNTIGAIADYFGTSATRVLSTPNTWISIVGDDGNTYKIPAYS